MKKIFTFFAVFVFLSSFVFAAEERNITQNSVDNETDDINDDSTDSEDDTDEDSEIDDSEETDDKKETETVKERINAEDKERIRASVQAMRGEARVNAEQFKERIKEMKINNTDDVKEIIKAEREAFKEKIAKEREAIRETKQKQNEVRLAVHTLLATENLTGIGKQVSAIAKDFDNSAEETERAEEKAMNKGRFMKFLFGGDRDSAEILRNKLLTREEKIIQMEQLINSCSDCSEDVKELLQQQIQVMKQDQERIKKISEEEGKSTGLFGWMFK